MGFAPNAPNIGDVTNLNNSNGNDNDNDNHNDNDNDNNNNNSNNIMNMGYYHYDVIWAKSGAPRTWNYTKPFWFRNRGNEVWFH